jgi:hypothetical protein
MPGSRLALASAGLAIVALLPLGCSLDGEGLLGPSTTLDSGPGRDARTPVPDASSVDTSTHDQAADGGTVDAHPLPDAGHDAGHDAAHDAPAEAAVVTWCSTQSPTPLFCDDFDTDDPMLAPPWGAVVVDGGTIGFTDAVASSPPSSASFTLTSETACHGTVLTKVFPTAYTTLDLAFDIYPDANDGEIASIAVGSTYQVDLSFGQPMDGNTYVQQDDPPKAPTFDGYDSSLTPGAWVRVGLSLALSPTYSITVTVGGTVVRTTAINPNEKVDAQGSPITVFLGPTCYNKTPARQLYYDNVVFDAH